MRKIVAMAVICLTAASGLTSAYAAQLADDEAGLRIRLKNELRRADKPSAGAGRDIYAWVQGGLLDFNSGYYSNIIGVEGGAYYVYKLGARADMSTRWYLNGDKSFGFALGAVKIKPSENSLLKLGRFGTDYSYGSLPYRIPLMAGSSQRTLPTVSEGALGYWALTPNIDLWGMWRSRVFYGLIQQPVFVMKGCITARRENTINIAHVLF